MREVFDAEGELEAFEITSYRQLLNTHRYVYRNPIEAGLCTSIETYPFSTLRFFLGVEQTDLPIIDRIRFVQQPARRLQWINSDDMSRFYKLPF